MCERNCENCHFWYFRDIDNSGYMNKEITDVVIDRDKFDKNFYFCYKGVWSAEFRHPGTLWTESDTKRRNEFDLKIRNIIKMNRSDNNPRGNSCFYRAFEEGMLLPAAEELEKRETIQKEASRDRKWIKWGVVATFIVAVITLIAAALGPYLTYYFSNKIDDTAQLITNHVKNEAPKIVSAKNHKLLEHKK